MPDDRARGVQLREFASALGITIDDYGLLDKALTHASATGDQNGPVFNYESLEFVGDAVLGLVVARYLYENLPDRTPGEYSKMRAGVVNRRALARVAEQLGIAEMIRLGKGEEKAGGRNRKALLADSVEAVIGALYLDQGAEASDAFVIQIFQEELNAAQEKDNIWDYRSRLQNRCQAHRVSLPTFNVVRETGPDHNKTFDVIVDIGETTVGRGTGNTKKEAEQNAARAALENEGRFWGTTQ